MGRKQKLFAYLFLINNIFPTYDWFVCLQLSLILISATLCHSNSVLKDLRKLMDLPRATGENVCVLFGA